MANDDAWQAGVDIATSNKDRRKKKGAEKDKNGAKTGAAGAQDAASGGGGNKWSILSYLPKLHSGGRVKKTGAYRLRKNEIVLTKGQQKTVGIKQGGKKNAPRKKVARKA